MNEPRTGATPSADQALLMLRVVGASLGVGVTIFAAVAWLAHQDGAAADTPADPTLIFNIMVSVVMVAIIAGIGVWRARVVPRIEGARVESSHAEAGGEPDAAARLDAMRSDVILVWAIMEAAALLAVVVHYLYDMPLAGVAGVLLIWGTLAATWPKRAWLGAGAGQPGRLE